MKAAALKRRWPVLFLAVVPLLILWPAVFGGQAIGPWDHIRSMAPWFGPKPSTPWDVLQADGVLQFAPWRSLVFESWSHGQIPAWNNYQLMGTPLLANSQSAGFYPLHILVGVLHIPLYPAMTFLAWFHLFWAGLGVYLLVRRMGGTQIGGAVAGASFALSAFMTYWTALPSVIATVAWIPWALACTIALFQTDLMWGITESPVYKPGVDSPQDALAKVLALRRSQKGWLLGVIGSIAMMVLAGHLQFVAFGLLAVVFVGVAMLVKLVAVNRQTPLTVIRHRSSSNGTEEESVRRVVGPMQFLPSGLILLKFAFAVAVAFCIAAPQLLPVLNFSKHSHRRSPPTADGYAAYTASAIQPFEWSSLVFPKMLGDPSLSANDAHLSLFWAEYVKRGDSFGESALAIGPLVLLLLCCLTKQGWKRGLPVALVGVLGILIACGTPFDALLYYVVPGWSSTGSPGRAIVLFVLACCCLAGLAIRPIDKEEQKNAMRGLGVFVLITIAITAAAFVGLDGLQSFLPGQQLSAFIHAARDQNMPMFLIAALFAVAEGALWIWRKDKIGLLLAAPILPFLLALGVLRTGVPIQPATQSSTFDRVAYVNPAWNMFVTPQAIMPPNMATLMRIHDVAGYDSLLDKDSKALLDAANKQDSSPPENGNMLFVKNTADEAMLSNLGVSTLKQNDPRYSPPLIETQISGAGRVSSTGGQATITSEDFRSISIDATGPGLLSLKDRNMYGWTATIDGKPAQIRPGIFREIDLPAGEHKVEFTYWPPGLTAGLVLFLLGLLLVPMTLLQGLQRGRAQKSI